MTRIQITADYYEGSHQGKVYEADLIVSGAYKHGWDSSEHGIFLADEVRVLGKHEGEYNPNHWGELNPDAYDRMSYRTTVGKPADYYDWLHGRHLLDTGVN